MIEYKQLASDIIGYRKSMVIKTFIDSGLLKLVCQTPGLSYEQLSAKLSLNLDRLTRVIRFLQMHNYLSIQSEKVHPTNLSQALNDSSTMKDWAICELQECYWKSWSKLTQNVQTATPAFELEWNMPFFEYLKQNPSAIEKFQKVMSSITEEVSSSIVENVDFKKYKKVIDIGGGVGTLGKKVKSKFNSCDVTVFDRKEVTPLSDHSLNFLSGDFFNKIPSDYDLYILKNILHDWEDDKAFQILKNISQAMKRDSRLLISEILIEEGKDSGKSLDLLMMVLFSGKERTQKQFKTLAAKAGLSLEIKVATVEKVDILIFKKIES